MVSARVGQRVPARSAGAILPAENAGSESPARLVASRGSSVERSAALKVFVADEFPLVQKGGVASSLGSIVERMKCLSDVRPGDSVARSGSGSKYAMPDVRPVNLQPRASAPQLSPERPVPERIGDGTGDETSVTYVAEGPSVLSSTEGTEDTISDSTVIAPVQRPRAFALRPEAPDEPEIHPSDWLTGELEIVTFEPTREPDETVIPTPDWKGSLDQLLRDVDGCLETCNAQLLSPVVTGTARVVLPVEDGEAAGMDALTPVLTRNTWQEVQSLHQVLSDTSDTLSAITEKKHAILKHREMCDRVAPLKGRGSLDAFGPVGETVRDTRERPETTVMRGASVEADVEVALLEVLEAQAVVEAHLQTELRANGDEDKQPMPAETVEEVALADVDERTSLELEKFVTAEVDDALKAVVGAYAVVGERLRKNLHEERTRAVEDQCSPPWKAALRRICEIPAVPLPSPTESVGQPPPVQVSARSDLRRTPSPARVQRSLDRSVREPTEGPQPFRYGADRNLPVPPSRRACSVRGHVPATHRTPENSASRSPKAFSSSCPSMSWSPRWAGNVKEPTTAGGHIAIIQRCCSARALPSAACAVDSPPRAPSLGVTVSASPARTIATARAMTRSAESLLNHRAPGSGIAREPSFRYGGAFPQMTRLLDSRPLTPSRTFSPAQSCAQLVAGVSLGVPQRSGAVSDPRSTRNNIVASQGHTVNRTHTSVVAAAPSMLPGLGVSADGRSHSVPSRRTL